MDDVRRCVAYAINTCSVHGRKVWNVHGWPGGGCISGASECCGVLAMMIDRLLLGLGSIDLMYGGFKLIVWAAFCPLISADEFVEMQ